MIIHIIQKFVKILNNNPEKLIRLRKARVKLKSLSLLRSDYVDLLIVKILIVICCVYIYGIDGRPAKLILYGDDNFRQVKYEISAQKCRAGVFLMQPTVFSCACITGVWAFYSKFCKKPFMIMGGDGYCFRMSLVNISQVILVGNPKYPFEPSISHFREDYIILTKSYTADDDTLALDAVSTFITITGHSWTLKGDTGESICLSPTEGRTHIFCLYDLTRGVIDSWREIVEVRRGCSSSNILEPQICEEISPPNDQDHCSSPDPRKLPTSTPKSPKMTTMSSTKISDMTTNKFINWSTTYTTTTTDSSTIIEKRSEKPVEKFCPEEGITHEDVKEYWNSPFAAMCPRSITELLWSDQLKRFAVLQMNREISTRQKSLEQTEELLSIQADLIKKTCPAQAVSPEFVQVVTEAFAMFVRDDFFYGMDETEESLYERIIYNLKTCLKRAQPFQFLHSWADCNRTKILNGLLVKGNRIKIMVEEENSWKNYEPLIESVWKIFLHAHSYCYQDFLRQNDHHSYSVRMLRLFSNSIYEKWIQPLPTRELYNYIIPNVKELELTMDNLDYCVGAVNYHTTCPVWLDRMSTKDSPQHGLISGGISRKKRSIWIGHLQNNREATEIWNGAAYCLQTAEDPSFHLGFVRCAHP